jgi:hypothetical protein
MALRVLRTHRCVEISLEKLFALRTTSDMPVMILSARAGAACLVLVLVLVVLVEDR